MDIFRREAQLIAITSSGLEKLIEKGAFVSLRIAEAGDESAHLPALDCDLYKLAFLKKAVHA